MNEQFVVRHSKVIVKDDYIFYNFIFQPLNEELKDWCFEQCRYWRKSFFTTDIKLAQDYKESIEFVMDYSNTKFELPISVVNHSGLLFEDVFVEGYEEVFNPILNYIKKFNLFQFKGHFMNSPATKGIIQTIEDLSLGINASAVIESHELFKCCLQSLNYHWD
jgi:hypothetical protein